MRSSQCSHVPPRGMLAHRCARDRLWCSKAMANSGPSVWITFTLAFEHARSRYSTSKILLSSEDFYAPYNTWLRNISVILTSKADASQHRQRSAYKVRDWKHLRQHVNILSDCWRSLGDGQQQTPALHDKDLSCSLCSTTTKTSPFEVKKSDSAYSLDLSHIPVRVYLPHPFLCPGAYYAACHGQHRRMETRAYRLTALYTLSVEITVLDVQCGPSSQITVQRIYGCQ